MTDYYNFDIDKFCEQLTDEWVLKELKLGEYAEEELRGVSDDEL